MADRSRTLSEIFDEYAEYHRHPLNRAAHALGFPLMASGALGLIESLGGLLCALALQALLAWAHLRMDRVLGAACTLALATCWLAGRWLPWPVQLAVVAMGLLPPALTHVLVERRWPRTAAQLLRFERVGHLWFLARAMGRLPASR